MKSFLLVFFVFSINAYGNNISIISDLDDTLKITNVSNISEAMRNALFSKKAFYGMPQLLEEMEDYSNDLYILTASPKILNKNIKAFLEFNEITYKDLTMRSIILDIDKKEYKLQKIRKILNETSDNFILIGDNVEIDAEVYLQIKREFPKRVLEIYIHRVNKNELSDGIQGFFTAFDIVRNEYKNNRMGFNQAMWIGQKIAFFKKIDDIMPDFVYCPTEKIEFGKVDFNALKFITNQINNKILKYCKSIR